VILFRLGDDPRNHISYSKTMTQTDDPILQSKPGVWRSRLKLFETAWRGTALSTILTGVLLLWLFILFMALVQFSTPDMPDNDGFYHIKLAYLMRTEGLTPDFTWLPLTILNARDFYDHHFLFHVALIPFTFGDLRVGAKWAAVIFAALAFLAAWWLLDRQRVPFAPLWALGLLAVSEAFIYRMSITRAQSLSLLLLLLSLHWLLTGKHRRMLLMGFLFVWTYNGFPLLFAMAGIYVVSAWLIERRVDLRPLVYSGLGIAVGLIINPYFPHNLVFIVQHIVPKVVDATSTSVGSEWYPYTTAQILENSPLALLAFITGAFALGLSRRRMDIRTAAAFLLACLFGLMLFQSRRFIEYFPPFALVFAAFAWTPVTDRLTAWYIQVKEENRERFVRRARYILALLLVFVLLFAAARTNLEASQASIQRSKPYTLYAGSSAWLQANTPAGSRVFQTDWDDFPRLFYYNTHNTYLVGLDPTYMQLYNEALYDRWVDITRGRVDLPGAAILNEFGARYVHSDLLHSGFLEKASQDPQLVEVYRDGDSVVFEVE
jgi:hypothetical protein